MKKEKFNRVLTAITDPNLKLQELGLYLTMLSLPDNWNYSIRGMAAILPEGATKITNTLKALEKKKYIERNQTNQGKFGHIIYKFKLPKKVNSSFRPKVTSENFKLLMNVLKNEHITLEERALYALIMFLPDKWKFSIRGLTQLTANQKLKVTSTLKKLISNQLIEDIEIRKRGKYLGHVYDVVDDPNSHFKQLVLDGSLKNFGSYFSVQPKPENPHTEKVEQYQTESSLDDSVNKSQAEMAEKIIKNHIDYDLLLHKYPTYRVVIQEFKDALIEVVQNKKGFVETENGTQLKLRIAQKALLGIRKAEAENLCLKITKSILNSKKIHNISHYIKQVIVNYASGLFVPAFDA